MSANDNGYNYGCNALDDSQDATLYSQCTSSVKEQGFDFVDAWYYSNIATNPYFSHNPGKNQNLNPQTLPHFKMMFLGTNDVNYPFKFSPKILQSLGLNFDSDQNGWCHNHKNSSRRQKQQINHFFYIFQ